VFDEINAHLRKLEDLNDLTAPAAEQTRTSQRAIHRGDIYWVAIGAGMAHPHVVIQEDVINHSRARSVVVCAMTSNGSRVSMPGNILLEAGEANLPRQSVVEVAKVSVVDRAQLGAYIGTLTEERVHQVLAGMRFLQSFTRAGERVDEKLE
jgi:mRNA interferase MazF